jgi:NDP-sugar pyrophosphorylase family protein
MLPLHGKPLLEYIISGLKFAGFTDFILVVGYKKKQIIDYFLDGRKFDVNIEYKEQMNLNGTGGALLLCEELITEQHFFLTWGDILVPPFVYKEVCAVYIKEKNDFLLVTNYSEDPHKGGAVYCDGIYCAEIIEKPPKGKSQSNLNNCGIFILSKEVFEILKTIKPSKRGEIELPTAISVGISKRNWKVRVFKLEKDQFRADFGDKNIYEKLKQDPKWLRFFNT